MSFSRLLWCLKKGHIVRAITATWARTVDLTHPIEPEAAQEIMDRIIALKEGNIDLLSRERYWRAGEGDDVELEDRDIEGRTLEADRAKK